MPDFRDDETLTANLDDELAGRVLKFLAVIETEEPSFLLFWLDMVRIWNEICQDEKNFSLIEKIMTILEERYVQADKTNNL